MGTLVNPRACRLGVFVGYSPSQGAYSGMSIDIDPTDYSVVVKNRAPLPKPWRWEIYCAGKRQPIKRSGVLYESRGEASLVGKGVLAELLRKIDPREIQNQGELRGFIGP
jgi:hypothetical protein